MNKLLNLFCIFTTFSFLLISCGAEEKKDIAKGIEKTEDAKPKLIKTVEITDYDSEVLSSKEVINYDKKGNISEQLKYDADNKLSTTEKYTYNENGDKIEFESINHDNPESNSKTKYFYDNNKKLIKQIEYNSSGDAGKEDTYTYDADGNVATINYTNSFTYKHEFVYENKKLKSKIYYNKDGTKDVEMLDEKGNRIDKNTEYKYDDKNNLVEVYNNDPRQGETKTTIQYKFDKDGNWIEQKTYVSKKKSELGELENTSKKVITYFE